MYLPLRGWFTLIVIAIAVHYGMLLYMEMKPEVKAIRLIQKGRGAEAVTLLDPLANSNPPPHGIHALRALAYLQSFEPKLALADVAKERKIATAPTPMDRALLDKCEMLALLLDGQSAAAKALADRGTADVKMPTLHATKALVYFATGDQELTNQNLQASVESNPDFFRFAWGDVFDPPSVLTNVRPEYLSTLQAIVLCDQKDYSGAVQAGEAARARNSAFALGELLCGFVERLNDHERESQRSFDLFLKAQEDHEALCIDIASRGIDKQLLASCLCVGLHRTADNKLIFPSQLDEQKLLASTDRFPQGGLPGPYQPSAEAVRDWRWTVTDAQCKLQHILGLCFIGVGFLLKSSKKKLKKLLNTDVGWTDARVSNDRPTVDLGNHTLFVVGVCLMVTGSARWNMPLALLFFAIAWLIWGGLQCAQVRGELAAVQEGIA